MKLVLNHKDGSVTGRYDRYEGLPEKREALQRWARHVEGVVGVRATADVIRMSAVGA